MIMDMDEGYYCPLLLQLTHVICITCCFSPVCTVLYCLECGHTERIAHDSVYRFIVTPAGALIQ